MIANIYISIFVCLVSTFLLLLNLRRDQVSLGLPIAYLFQLLLYHVPGAFVQLVSDDFFYDSAEVSIGIRYTAIATVCFVIGAWWAHRSDTQEPIVPLKDHRKFWLFGLVGGLFFTYGLVPLRNVPSLGAAITKGAAIWMLGVLLGLRYAVQQRDRKWIAIWLAALTIYPVLTLVIGGFLSYGAVAVIFVCSALTITTRQLWRVGAGIVVAGFLGMTVFVNYFESRDVLRSVIWHDATLGERLDAVSDVAFHVKLFNSTDDLLALIALDQRLNQNYFVGLAAERIEHGDVDYLYGGSVTDALLSLIPRALWPNKTVFAGSGSIVADMTGLPLSTDTSWGVGNVMEFQINFGMPGLILGFLGLGWLLGTLDRKAALAEARGDFPTLIVCFLPVVAIAQPINSFVEMSSGAAAAFISAYGWRWGWARWNARNVQGDHSPPEEGHTDAADVTSATDTI